jgi:hypothetical protein
MRIARLIPALVIACIAGPALAQEWFDYVNKEDKFSVNLPAQPRVEKFTYISEYDSKLPATRYTAEHNGVQYMMTVVDMNKTDREPGRHGTELRGSIQFHATKLRRSGTVTMDIYNEIQVVPGQMLQITLPDGRRNYAGIYLHQRRLYVMEAIAPAGRVPPILYQASLNFLDDNGNSVRYEDGNYSFPDGRPLARGGGGAAAGGARGGNAPAAGGGGAAPAGGGGYAQ